MSPVSDIMARIVDAIINPLMALLFAIALVVFLWGVAEYVWKASDDTKKKEGKNHMLWGIIGMFIMLAAVGIVNLIVNSLGGSPLP